MMSLQGRATSIKTGFLHVLKEQHLICPNYILITQIKGCTFEENVLKMETLQNLHVHVYNL